MNHKLILLMFLGPILAQKCPSWNLSQLVSISPLIVEASVLAHGQIDGADKIQVTFKVKKSLKNTVEEIKYIRMTFALSNHSNHELCPVTIMSGFFQDHHRRHNRRKRRKKFYIFAKNSRLFGFEPIVSPLRRTKRAKQALNRALCAYQSQYCHQSKLRNFGIVTQPLVFTKPLGDTF